MLDEQNIRIVPMTVKYVPEVARLHADGIKEAFISSLGYKFVCCIYQAIVESNKAFGFVAEADGKVLGFVSFAENTGELYKTVLRKNFLKLFWYCLPKMLNLKNIKRAIETLFYPLRCADDLPAPELLSIVVRQEARGIGLGKKLVAAGNAEFKKRCIGTYKVIVYKFFESNEFYKHLGFRCAGEYAHHGDKDIHSVYVMEVGQ